ncbi:MAG: cupin domain-containing protein [Minicystis sp.]
MDALSAVLAPVRLRKTRWASTVGRAPWGLAVPGARNCVRFHYVIRGSAWLALDKSDAPQIALSGGDLAVFPHGHGHALRDNPRSPLRSWNACAKSAAEPTPGVFHMNLGTQGAETTFLTGAFVIDDPLATPILATLPPLIRMNPDTEQAVPSFLENIQFITREVETNRPGSEIVLLRMADVMFIQNPPCLPGALRRERQRVPPRPPRSEHRGGARRHAPARRGAVDGGLARRGSGPLALGLRGAFHRARR